MRQIELDLSPREMKHNGGFGWTAHLPHTVAMGDDSQNNERSVLELFEDGKPLGPAHSGHDDIREKGGGLFAHWQDTLYFSSSDNVDPKASGRRYSIRGERRQQTIKSEPTAERAPLRCPCCGFSTHLKPFQMRRDFDGQITAIEVCAFCTALINRTALERAFGDRTADLKLQEDGSVEVYGGDRDEADIRRQMEACRGTLQVLLNDARHPVARGTAIDLGAGAGFLAAAACDYFDDVWALEINHATLGSMRSRLGLDDVLKMGRTLDEVPGKASLIMSWHALEHLPDLWSMGIEAAQKLEVGGVFYWQVPMFKDEYVVPGHYTFLNEYSASVFCERIGLSLQDVWHDMDYQFMTCVARKLAA